MSVNSGVLLTQGQEYFAQGDYVHAIQVFSDLTSSEPQNTEAWAWLARTHNASGDLDAGLAAAEQAIALDSTCALAYRQRGYIRYEKDDYKMAVDDFTQAIKYGLGDAITYYLLGQAYYFLSDLDHSIDNFEHYLSLNPDDADGYLWLGKAQGADDQLQEAVGTLTQAIRLQPHEAPAYYWRANAYYYLENLPKAVDDLTIAIALDPQDARSYLLRGHCYTDQKQYDQALANYNLAVQLDPTDATGLLGQGNVKAVQGDIQAALSDFSQAIQVDPQKARAHELRGDAYMSLNLPEKALEDYTRAFELDPESDSLRQSIKVAQQMSSGQIRQLPEPSPESIELFMRAAGILERGGTLTNTDTRNAISLLSQAIARAGGPFPRAHALIAMLYIDTDNPKEARRHAEAALEEDPSEFRAQLVKVQLAGDKTLQLHTNAAGLIPRGIGALYLFEVAGKLAKGAFDASKVAVTQALFKSELEKLLSIFDVLYSIGLPAADFAFFSDRLLTIADALQEHKVHLPGGNPSIYERIAHINMNELLYSSDRADEAEEREFVKQIVDLAKGRARMR